MVNRNLQAKHIKYLKQRRARPKFLRIDHKPDHWFKKGNIPVDMVPLFEYRKRGDTPAIDDFLDAKFPSHNQVGEGRQQAEKLANTLRTLAPVKFKTMLEDGKYFKTAMVADSSLTCITFIQFEVIPKLIKHSITYGNYDRAMQVFHLRTIRWKEVINLSSVESTPLD